MSEKYKVGDSAIPHFITITVVEWIDPLRDFLKKREAAPNNGATSSTLFINYLLIIF